MLSQLFAGLGSASPRLKRSLWKSWYDLLAARYQHPEWTFMNYGYSAAGAGPEIALAVSDERDRYSIQLYHHVVGDTDLRGARILEVGCGRGGGCSYLARTMHPEAVLGVDFSPRMIAFCRRVHAVPRLSFQQGDAEDLPCGTGSFDALLNVESSHHYGSMPRFLKEAFRVLKPGGYFLWADLRRHECIEETRRQFGEAGFKTVRESVITGNVLSALDRLSQERQAMIERLVPRFLVRSFQDFAGVPGTRVYDSLYTGAVQYLSCALYKPLSPSNRTPLRGVIASTAAGPAAKSAANRAHRAQA